MSIFRSSALGFDFHFSTSTAFKFRRLWKPKHRQQQQAASTTAGGKDKCYSPLVHSLFFFFLSFSAASANSLLSLYLLPSLSFSFSWVHRRLHTHARVQATSVARVVRATQTQPLYTRSLCFSFSLIPLTQSTCLYAITISLQRARESRKGKSRCKRVRRSCTFASGRRALRARERKNGWRKSTFPPFR